MSTGTKMATRVAATAWSLFDALSLSLRMLLYLCLWPLLEIAFVFRVRRYLRIRSETPLQHTEERYKSDGSTLPLGAARAQGLRSISQPPAPP